MNRYLVAFILALIVVAVIAVGVVLLLRSGSQTPIPKGETPVVVFPSDSQLPASPQNSASQVAARAAFQREVDADNPDNIKLGTTIVSGGYALQAWGGDITGGEAVLKYDMGLGRWILVVSSGGTWGAAGLASYGVPEDTAAALVAGMGR
ncbi:MAG: hypothetical protein JWL87_512 [Candidatus Adlerbacteria bacterium]|nr:hypothetical protein [Candidatus Adlerbacteria bacterium]